MLYASYGLGAFLAGSWMSLSAGRIDLVTTGAVAVILLSLACIAFGLSSSALYACSLLAAIGGCIVCVDIGSQTLVQSAIRTRFRGRTISTYGIAAQGMPALGALAMGGFAEALGLRAPIIGGGLACLAAGYLAWVARDRIKRSFRSRE